MSLEKYVDQAGKLYRMAYTKVETFLKERERAEAEQYGKESKMHHLAVAESRAEFNSLWNERKDAILNELSDGVKNIESKFKAEIDNLYRPDGTLIDEADMRLLQSGILTEKELSDMVEKHSKNATMLRVLNKHMKENFASSMDRFATGILRTLKKAETAGEEEARLWKKLNDRLKTPIAYALNNGLTEVFYNAAVNYEEVVEDAKMDILKAKLFIDEETQNKINEYDKSVYERKAEVMRRRAGSSIG